MIEVDISESEQAEEVIDTLDKAMSFPATRKRQAEMPSSASSSSAGPLKQARFARGTKQPAGGNTLKEIHPGGHFMHEDELPKVLFPDDYYRLSKKLSEFLRHKADQFCRVWP